MFFGFNRGRGTGRRGGGGGMGFGFRGSSPPWPYVGRGRGGLPRCGYYLGDAAAPARWLYRSYAGPSYSTESAPPSSGTTKEEELNYMKNQAEAIKGQLEEIESRMHDLEAEK